MNRTQEEILRRYPKAVSHLRRQVDDGRLGFILGAGVSMAYNIPTWGPLIHAVAQDPSVNAGASFRESNSLPLPILAEVLFQRFSDQARPVIEESTKNLHDIERLLHSKWRKLIHKVLYKNAPTSVEDLDKVDSGLRHFLEVIRKSVLTVTYNFDDILERLLLHHRTSEEKEESLTFQSVVDARLPFRRDRTIILHPNGLLPHNLLETNNDTLVLNEGSFADQMIDVMAGQFSTMLHYLTKNTFLLIGLSLEDETLRHLLRQSARLSPGNYHYYVRFIPADSKVSQEDLTAEAQSNFNVYNLITLHLTDGEIKALGDILSMLPNRLRACAEEAGVDLHYTYYLTGVPGVGKTTTFAFFNSLVTHDEWTEPRLSIMSLPYTSLSAEQEKEIDNWIMDQLYKKNLRMQDEKRERVTGIHLVDRCPPDAITFTRPPDWPDKAKQILCAVSPGNSNRLLHDGHVIMLEVDPREVVVRAAMRAKKSSVDYAKTLMEALRTIYPENRATIIPATGMTPTEVAKWVARIIFLDDYREAELHEIVQQVADGSISSPHSL